METVCDYIENNYELLFINHEDNKYNCHCIVDNNYNGQETSDPMSNCNECGSDKIEFDIINSKYGMKCKNCNYFYVIRDYNKV